MIIKGTFSSYEVSKDVPLIGFLHSARLRYSMIGGLTMLGIALWPMVGRLSNLLFGRAGFAFLCAAIGIIEILYIFFVIPETNPALRGGSTNKNDEEERRAPRNSSEVGKDSYIHMFGRIFSARTVTLVTACVIVCLTDIQRDGSAGVELLYLQQIVDFAPKDISLTMFVSGILGFLCNLLVLPRAIKRGWMNGERMIYSGLLGIVVFQIGMAFTNTKAMAFCLLPLQAVPCSWFPAGLSAILSRYYGSDKIGHALGVLQSFTSLCGCIGPVVIGSLFAYTSLRGHGGITFLAAGIVSSVSFLVAVLNDIVDHDESVEREKHYLGFEPATYLVMFSLIEYKRLVTGPDSDLTKPLVEASAGNAWTEVDAMNSRIYEAQKMGPIPVD